MCGSVAVVGPGRMGTVLARALERAGHSIDVAVGGGPDSRKRFRQRFPGAAVGADLTAVSNADLVLITTPDDAVADVVVELVDGGAVGDGQRVVHLAGALGLAPLEVAAAAGVRVAACHPAQTVASADADPDVLAGAAWAVTAADDDLEWARDLVRSAGGVPYTVADSDRAVYHAGLTVGSNAVGAVVSVASRMLTAAGLPSSSAFLDPLVPASVANVLSEGPAAITGPIARGDHGTVVRHLARLEESSQPGLARSHRLLLQVVLAEVRDRLDPAVARQVEEALRTDDGRPVAGPVTDPVPVVATVAAAREAIGRARDRGERIGLVPTMGALHAGHLALVRAAAEHAGTDSDRRLFVVVSVFVNPTQFGPDEDYEAYPRDLDADRDALVGLGDAAPQLIYAPSVAEMYPAWQPGDDTFSLTEVSVNGLTERLCGASRPGHFDGVTTVVAKLFNQVTPDVAFFGRKDFQQLQVIRRMTADLNQSVEIVGVPTVREPDGVATSSRNDYLDGEQRTAARCLSQGLAAAVRAARDARGDGRSPTPALLRERAGARIAAEPGARVDYVEVVDPRTLAPPPAGAVPSRLLVAVAVHVGPARLIDNVVIGDETDEVRLLDAVESAAAPLDASERPARGV